MGIVHLKYSFATVLEMKQFIAIIVSLCLLLQCAAQLGIMGMYQVRKEYIAKNLCVNKNKPKMHCNGKCHLKKQLKKASEQQDKQDERSNEEVSVAVAFVLPQVWQPLYHSIASRIQHVSFYNAPAGINPCADIFHPPQA